MESNPVLEQDVEEGLRFNEPKMYKANVLSKEEKKFHMSALDKRHSDLKNIFERSEKEREKIAFTSNPCIPCYSSATKHGHRHRHDDTTRRYNKSLKTRLQYDIDTAIKYIIIVIIIKIYKIKNNSSS